MLGLLLIYFVGRYFYRLAEEHYKNKWGYAIFGVFSYYVGVIFSSILIVMAGELWGSLAVDQMNEFVLNLLAQPLAILTAVGVYFVLKKRWQKNTDTPEDIIEEIGRS